MRNDRDSGSKGRRDNYGSGGSRNSDSGYKPRGGNSGYKSRGGNSGYQSRGPREMHKAVCSDCKQETEVPFKPSGDRPVYCRECLKNHRPPKRSSRY